MATNSDDEIEQKGKKWVADSAITMCMICNVEFGIFTRKHHCRNCGSIICHSCSPNNKILPKKGSEAVRVCNTCYPKIASIHNGETALQEKLDEPLSIPRPVIQKKNLIGQVYVKIIEAIGLPSAGAISNDPFAQITLTGRWGSGNEWGENLQFIRKTKYKASTINPRWNEAFLFNVYAPGGEITFEIFDYGQISEHVRLCAAKVPLFQLLDQQKHNMWLDLYTPSKYRPKGKDFRAPRIHVLMYYKFSKTAEMLSHFMEEESISLGPEFTAATLYSNFWVFLDDLWPYIKVFLEISPILSWELPLRSLLWLGIMTWICLYVEWLPVLIHLALIAFTMNNFFENCSDTSLAEKKTFDPSMESFIEEDIFENRRYKLPIGLNHLTNQISGVTLDGETKETLRGIQNNLSGFSLTFRGIEMMFSWENPLYTAQTLIALFLSCFAHIFIPNKYIFVCVIGYIFIMNTRPYQMFSHYLRGLQGMIMSLFQQSQMGKNIKIDKRLLSNKLSHGSRKKSDGSTKNTPISLQEEKFGVVAEEVSKRINLEDSKETKKNFVRKRSNSAAAWYDI